MTEQGLFGPLDLSTADMEGFKAIPADRYNLEVVEFKMDATKNPDGKMPMGTPILKVQFKVADGEYENRRLFDQFVIPPADYDPKAAATMKGFMARFFVALGFTEEEVKTAGWTPDFESLKGAPIVAVVGVEPKKINGQVVEDEFNNPIKGYKPAGSIVEADASGLL